MHIDLHHEVGEITSYGQKRSENDDGETAKIRIDLGLRVWADRGFLDKYLEGHNSGAQPSLVFWREHPNDPKAQAFARYLGIDKLVLATSDQPQYTLKLTEKLEEEETLRPPREFLIDSVTVKKLAVVIGPNGCSVDLKVRFFPRPEWVRDLTDMQLASEVDVCLHNTNTDLFAAAPAEPRQDAPEADAEPAPATELE